MAPSVAGNLTMTVSVVIPTHDRSLLLRRAIDSVLRQTVMDLEILVVDDGSREPIADIVSSYGDSRLRVIRNESCLGPSAARNRGIAAASGEYIAFLDSDDEWAPGKLARQIDILETGHPEAYAVCTGYSIVYGPNVPVGERRPPNVQNWPLYLLSKGCDLGPGSTLMVRRMVFDEIGLFLPELERYEDWDWLLRFVSRYRLAIAPESLAVVHYSGSPTSARLETSIPVFLRHWESVARDMGPTVARRLRARLFLDLARARMAEGRTVAGVAAAFRGAANWPLQGFKAALRLAKGDWLSYSKFE